MRENILNLPIHLRRQRVVTAEQVALAMAGVYDCNFLNDLDPFSEPRHIAASYWKLILHDIHTGALVCKGRWQDIGGNTTGADFYAKDVWPWALKELSEDGSWYGEESAATLTESNDMASTQWGEFAGRDTALMMIAGLATALQKSGGRYSRNSKINKSSVISAAIKAINEHGTGTDITDRALRNLLDDALRNHLSKLEK